jgi:hypothetical protein
MFPPGPETPCFQETEDMLRIKKFASQQHIKYSHPVFTFILYFSNTSFKLHLDRKISCFSYGERKVINTLSCRMQNFGLIKLVVHTVTVSFERLSTKEPHTKDEDDIKGITSKAIPAQSY